MTDVIKPTGCIVVLTTVSTAAAAERLAKTLVEERLAACVNILAEMQSIYRWKGGVEHDREHQLVIKTSAGRLATLRARLAALHPYELPELLVLPVIEGSQEYLDWVREATEEGKT